ncbi:hypothetical protein SDC9_160872 [bioreactor metagenome]|uniref:Uncharacterized protein n=1 Tax=bioreactor metagenome TaxID=1076179 RepID=A0A645FGQ0_9ZZZZ
MARLHRIDQIDVGGRHQAHIDIDRTPRPQPDHLPFLQHAQQLHLHRQGQVAYLIEEQRSVLCSLEPARPRTLRAGERPRLMPEQFSLDQGLAECPAVDGNKRSGTSAAVMDMPGNQLLSSAGVADDQHRRITGRDQFGRPEHLQ